MSMYARGISTREIAGHLHDLYGIDASPDLISTATDAVLDEVATWQRRPLDTIFFCCVVGSTIPRVIA